MLWLRMFAGPLGNIINNALTAGGAAAVAWSVKQGLDQNLATAIFGSLISAASVAISGLAATQGVQIPRINDDQTNGVRVVKASDARKAGLPPVDKPLMPHNDA